MKRLKPVLLIEPDHVEAITTERALKEMKVINPLVHVMNPVEAMGYIRNESNEKPCVILLDLNTPSMTGIEFLRARDKDQVLGKLPVIVLMRSPADRDVVESFKLSVAGYMTKPFTYRQFVEVIKGTSLCWRLAEKT